MNTAAHTPQVDTPIDLPVARIDSEDALFIRPLQEFLEAHECIVVSGRKPAVPATYHIVCGQAQYVKKFFSIPPQSDERRFVILLDETIQHAKDIAKHFHARVAIIETKLLDSRDVEKLFEFFFTSADTYKDFRIGIKPTKEESDIPQSLPQKQATPFHEDHERDKAEAEGIVSTQSEQRKREIIASTTPGISDADRIQEAMGSIYGKPLRHRSKTKHAAIFHPGTMLRLFVAIAVFALPFVWYVSAVGVATGAIWYGMTALHRGDTTKMVMVDAVARTSITQAQILLSLASFPFTGLGAPEMLRGQERLLSLFTDVVSSQRGMNRIIDEGKDIADIMLAGRSSQGNNVSAALSLEQLRELLLSVQNSLGLSQAQLNHLLRIRSFPFSVPWIASNAQRGKKAISRAHRSVSDMLQFLSLYPEFVGFREKKTYLIIFQNSLELRPTGGFIGSIATAVYSDGILSDFAISDVYTVDGQLKGHVDPPGPIRELLGAEHWYLRDANWDPDFPSSASRISWFYDKETGSLVDGVIAVSTPFVVDLLRATGPIELADYNDRITAENFYGKSLFYTQADFFPGSTQKKDFLGNLAQALIAKMTSAKGIQPQMLLQALSTGLSSGDVLLWFSDATTQSMVERFGWAGKLPRYASCPVSLETQCVFDSLAIIEANLGVNKLNYFIKRDIHLRTKLAEDGAISHVVTLHLQNTANTEKLQGNTYRSYIRLLLPESVAIQSVTLAGQDVPQRVRTKKAAPFPPYMEVEQSNLATVLGVALEAPPGSEQQLAVSYTLSGRLQFEKNSASYAFLLQKQPGMINTTFGQTISYPQHWTARSEDSSRLANIEGLSDGQERVLAKETQLEYNRDLSRSYFLSLRFSK